MGQRMIARLIFIFGLVLQCNFVLAVDPYNTYRFNRVNHDAGSNRVDDSPWYEWWYYKVILEDGTPFFWVYGVVNPWDLNTSNPATRSYLSVGNFATHEIYNENSSLDSFTASYNETFVRIGDAVATDHSLQGSIQSKDGPVSWNLSIQKEWGWNAMGWGLPFNPLVNISWYPAQSSALMSGSIDYKGRHYELKNAKAYQDRNWGTGFPSWWFWIVSNNFNEDKKAVLTCGGGMPKILGHEVIPIISCGLRTSLGEYSFRNTDLEHSEYEISFGKWELSILNGNKKLKVSASAPREKFMDLQFMSPQNTIFHDLEALDGSLVVELWEWSIIGGWSIKNRFTSMAAGIEYGSENPDQLMEKL